MLVLYFIEVANAFLFKGNIMPINRTIFKIISWGIIPTPNVINFISLETLLNVESNHHHCLVVWKPFEHFLGKGKEIPYR